MRFIRKQRLGSGDGERNTLLTRQIAFEPYLHPFCSPSLLRVVSLSLATLQNADGSKCQERSTNQSDNHEPKGKLA
jgi:hypothetical protein